MVGDQKYEHTQNITLQRILNDSLNLQSSRELLDQQQQQQGADDPQQQLLAKGQRSNELSRFMNAWLRLQNDVNALMDSTTAENTDQQVGDVTVCIDADMDIYAWHPFGLPLLGASLPSCSQQLIGHQFAQVPYWLLQTYHSSLTHNDTDTCTHLHTQTLIPTVIHN